MYYRVIRTEDYYTDYLEHHGTIGQKKGIRLYQYKDGSLTPLGRIHYNVGPPRVKQEYSEAKKLTDEKDAAKAKIRDDKRLKNAEIKAQQKNQQYVQKMQDKAAREKAEQANRDATNKLYLEREKTKQMKAEAAKAKAEAERAKEIAYDSDEEYNKKLGEYSNKFADLTIKGASNEELEKLTKEVLAFIDAKNKQVKAVDLASKIANGDKAGAVKLANDMLDNPKNPKTMTKEELEAETARLKAEKAYNEELGKNNNYSIYKNRRLSDMTDKEIKDALDRKKLEDQFRDATDKNTKKFIRNFGNKVVDTLPGKLAETAIDVGSRYLKKQAEQILGLSEIPKIDWNVEDKKRQYKNAIEKDTRDKLYEKDTSKMTPAEQAALRSYLETHSVEEAAKKFKIAESTAYSYSKHVNKSSSSDSTGDRVTGHGPDGALSKKDRQKLEEAHKNKTSAESVAANLGLTDDAVKNYFKQLEEKG